MVSALPFSGPVRRLVSAHKDEGRRDARPLLASLLLPPLAVAVGTSPSVVVAVPSSARARRRRGDDPLAALVESAVSALVQAGAPLAGPADARIVRPRRAVHDQAGLDARARAVNLEYSMEVPRRLVSLVTGARCVVVDDVVTTGATLVEAARALRAAGAEEVLAATMCATQRRTTPARSVS